MEYVLRMYNGLVSLDNPGTTWTAAADFPVEVLPPGTKLEIEL
jgi:hypothetical protein